MTEGWLKYGSIQPTSCGIREEWIGKILPQDVERNLSGFLVRKDVITFEVNSQKLIACIALLIATCVGPKPDLQTTES